ncbi:ATPase family protein associated with various cellular activities (AAA) [Tahibacter aquaticus]|uniref:ATPase family protein associated with various cellular activities (AAA) n=1 Tax=Tahibacter aquaticus TaxID=520092 RepID=A0A4R6Z042_9GAMM|nr:ATP-binding protein [Tahibacter aquaticus]TDR44858.1 ATPase family protein associated with various cellular activities (AAA) [Tahibacter aquaticus]
MNAAVATPPSTFTPQIRAQDPLAASWLAEATLRLRREVCWLWRSRADTSAIGDAMPPFGEAAQESLDLKRFDAAKRRFFDSDLTARHLGEEIDTLRRTREAAPGRWAAIVYRLDLDDTAQLMLALGLLARADAAAGPVFAACHSDAQRSLPSTALLQQLCDDPLAVLALDASHALFRFGLLLQGDGTRAQQGFEASALIAAALLYDDGRLPPELHRLPAAPSPAPTAALRAACSLLRETPRLPQFLPLLGDAGSDFPAWAALVARLSGRLIVELRGVAPYDPARLAALAAWCWLHGVDVLLPVGMAATDEHARRQEWPAVPVRWLLPMRDLQASKSLPAALLQPPLPLPSTDHASRLQRLRTALGPRARGLDSVIAEVAQRFRIGADAIDAIGVAARAFDGPLQEDDLHALCRAQTRPDLGNLAQLVQPRFRLDELVLPPVQRAHLDECVNAARALSRVHYEWGTAAAWNEAGLSLLFCGAPGTGKTMAAEAVADALRLPLYRIDLSQVVNKYIGETEKNLRRVFDAVEESDCVVFFDEADALFGKRTSVKDAHDRFANIEISYLLERMERLKGVAILATNRRDDLDDAFLRRLRYLVEFPLPGEAERERLWRYVFPPAVDTSAIDFAFLARLLPLAGGHIRSVAFNACLQAARSGTACVDMRGVLAALKRELDKLDRPTSAESFGDYADLVRDLYAENGP